MAAEILLPGTRSNICCIARRHRASRSTTVVACLKGTTKDETVARDGIPRYS
jgi:hypothetical protein